MTDCCVLLVTTNTADAAAALGRALVTEGLAACVNVVGPIRSIYRWQGEVCDDSEHLLVVKTRTGLVEAAAARIRSLHTYETPEIIALPIVAGSADYLAWLRDATARPGP